MDLFSHQASARRVNQPLAERMRPRSLEEFVGQGHLLGTGRLLSGVLMGKALPSLILFGPPGTGKTTLARLLARRVRAELIQLSAVSAGVKDIREAVAVAAQKRDERGYTTVLFIDEIHRFSKSQQDALLPHVEAGTVILIGATTENPSFEVNAALLSRCRVLRLEALTDDDLDRVIDAAVADRERGLGQTPVQFAPEVRETLRRAVGGDARRLLNTLEVATALAGAGSAAAAAVPEASAAPLAPTQALRLELGHLEEALQQKTLLYDKQGDEHYGVVSAFIKSMRGSDPDAAVYWMVRMLEAGEDPLFILRRMVIFAAEDIGLADPQALSLVNACVDAFRFVGLPEGVLPLTQTVIYLACAPKSNTALTTYAAARRAVREHGSLPVPAKLRPSVGSVAKQLGHGAGYRYPHEFEGHYVAERYLPAAIEDQRFYAPTSSGREAAIKDHLSALHAQLRGAEASTVAAEAEEEPADEPTAAPPRDPRG